MPSKSAQRASEFASEVKKSWFPYLTAWLIQNYELGLIPGSYIYDDSTDIDLSRITRPYSRPSIAILEGDAIDYALSWQSHERIKCPLINMANISKPGGDWETIAIGPEENLARRSNLVPLLQTRYGEYETKVGIYPISPNGGIYTSDVVIYRDGADEYSQWAPTEFKTLPVISVAPVRRPRLSFNRTRYAFSEERALMRESMRSVLRIAAAHSHHDVCIGAFGIGVPFRNPPREVAELWKDLLFKDAEFKGLFRNIIFTFDTKQRSTGAHGSPNNAAEMQAFQEVLDPLQMYRNCGG